MNIKKIIFKNYDFAIGFIIFISYRFYFNYLLFMGRSVPPEPDDSYFYLSAAASVFHPQNFEDFRLLPYSLYLKLISFLTQTNLEVAYQINFYIGPILLFACLAYFLHKLEVSKKIRLLLFIMLTLYSGSGSYHGFYWVVPSFYQLALFFVMLTFVIDQKPIKIINVLPVSLAFIFIHPTSMFVSSIFIIYPLVLSFFKKKLSIVNLKNTAVICAALIISYLIYFLLGLKFPHAESPESFQTNIQLVIDFLSGKLKPDSFPIMWSEYFSIFFINPLTILAYFSLFYLVYRIKQFKIIAIYVSSLILVLISSFIPYGWRTLGFLWPATFLLIGYALVGLYLLLNQKKIVKSLLVIALVVLLTIVTTMFNFISIKSVGAKENYAWERGCVKKVEGKEVFFSTIESSFAFIAFGFNREKAFVLNAINLERLYKEGGLAVGIRKERSEPYRLSFVENKLTSFVTRREQKEFNIRLDNSWNERLYSIEELDLSQNNLESNLLYDCGHYIIYSIDKI